MKKYVKAGFGMVIGMYIGQAIVTIFEHSIASVISKDEKYMDDLKERNPERYETIKKLSK